MHINHSRTALWLSWAMRNPLTLMHEASRRVGGGRLSIWMTNAAVPVRARHHWAENKILYVAEREHAAIHPHCTYLHQQQPFTSFTTIIINTTICSQSIGGPLNNGGAGKGWWIDRFRFVYYRSFRDAKEWIRQVLVLLYCILLKDY